MGLLNFFKKQLASVIEWKGQADNVVWYRYPSATDEIKNASKLIVAPSQGCVLVYEGKVMDVLLEEGVYSLSTDNHPFITSLQKVRQLFESEHKLQVYFFRKAQIVNQGWGTPSQVKYVDPIYQLPIVMGANGNFSYRISNIEFLYREVIGDKTICTTDDIKAIICNRLPEAIISYLSRQKHSYQQIDSQLEVMSKTLLERLNTEFEQLGLQLTDFRIIGTLFDTDTQQRIGKIADLVSDVRAAEVAGLSYVELEKLKALRDAARNEGGVAGLGVQMGAGAELGKQAMEFTTTALQDGNADVFEKLRKLNILLQEKVITEEDYLVKKNELLNTL